jgi:hypothetical protein
MLCTGLAQAQDIPDGGLGHPLGTYLTIEGVRAEQLMWGFPMRVDTVNGKKLEKQIEVWVSNVDLPKDARCILRGYETGSMIGTPPAVIEAAKEDGKDVTLPQVGWQFHRVFIVLSVVEPKDLKKK